MSKLLWWGHCALALITLLAYASPFVSPHVFWPASFASLAYPSLVVAHVLLAGYWLYRGQRRWLLSLVVLGLGYGWLRSYVGMQREIAIGEQQLSVATYNLLGGRFIYHQNTEQRANRIESLMACLDADVVALQEYTRYEALRAELDAAFAKTGLTYRYLPDDTYVVIYSRYPIVEREVLATYNQANGAIRARIDVAGDTLEIVAAHLQSNRIDLDARELVADAAQAKKEAYWTVRTVARNYRQAARKRAEDAAALARQLEQLKYPAVLLGDLNDTPLSYTLGSLRRAGLYDAFRQNGSGLGFTYAGAIPGLRIDYVLPTPNLTTESTSVTDCGFSDHKAVRSVLSW